VAQPGLHPIIKEMFEIILGNYCIFYLTLCFSSSSFPFTSYQPRTISLENFEALPMTQASHKVSRTPACGVDMVTTFNTRHKYHTLKLFHSIILLTFISDLLYGGGVLAFIL